MALGDCLRRFLLLLLTILALREMGMEFKIQFKRQKAKIKKKWVARGEWSVISSE